jgi:hypothetical protein
MKYEMIKKVIMRTPIMNGENSLPLAVIR